MLHHWPIDRAGRGDAARAILLHGGAREISEHQVRQIADYLNEFDSDGEGRWTTMGPASANYRRLEPHAFADLIRDGFHVGIGSRIGCPCHLIFDPDLLGPESIAHMVGDIFLDWLARQHASTLEGPSCCPPHRRTLVR
jgi:hypothetical protein